MKKDEGSVIHMFSIVFTTVFTALILVIYAGMVSNINRRSDADLIARKYLLKMETTGGLTKEQKQELIDELKTKGVINVDLTGTTEITSTSNSNYGELITLNINGDMKFVTYDSNKTKAFDMAVITFPLSISKTSTSKN